MSIWKKIGIGVFFIVAIAGYLGWDFYKAIYDPMVPSDLKNDHVQIEEGTSFQELLTQMHKDGQLLDTSNFSLVAKQMKYKKNPVRSGRYKITPGMSNIALIRQLRAGAQATVRVVLHDERLLSDLAGKLAKTLAGDSLDFLQTFNDPKILAQYDYTPQTLMSLFVPNSYDFYWNATPKDFLEKMQKEHDKFWAKNNRLQKANDLGLSKVDVYTLASIIKRETNAPQELPTIAGLYLNRLEKGMLLQADPTVVFATGQFDLRRVLLKHLEIDSPYNTYKNVGLPPGPISMASIGSLDAVLNREAHDYIFFCAKPDNSGLHSFAKTLSGHNANARRFHAWLNKRGIR